jgi:integrase
MNRPRASTYWSEQRKSWIAQLDWTDEAGKRRQRKRQTESKTEARDLCRRWIQELEAEGPKYLDAEKITFAYLADEYEAKRLVPPEYRDGKKVKGMRDWKSARARLKISTDHFGAQRIRSITYADLENFRDELLARLIIWKNKKGIVTKTKERSIGDVNRILARLSGAFTYAYQKEWISRSPFSKGETLIVMSQEVARERCLSTDEQRRLLQACQNTDRHHIYPLILTALDSGARRGELLKMIWQDVDLDRGELHVLAFNAKTNKPRTIDLEPFTVAELRRLWEMSPQDLGDLVFGIKTNFTKAWKSALTAAEITTHTRFHDLRATSITFGLLRGRTMEFAMKRSGHSDPRVFMRYVRMAEEVRDKQREQLSEWELASSLAELAGDAAAIDAEPERSELIN